ncbi:MAG: hypothetical protein AABM30_03670 [Actinomycetota bacterium]
MRCGRLAIAILVVSTAGAASFLPSSDAAKEARGYSHRISLVSGQLVDHWTVTDSAPCHATGRGTLTVKFRFAKTKLVKLVLDRYHSSNTPGKLGSWVVGIPGPNGGGARDMPYQPATGTITFADLTTQNPPAPGTGDCEPLDKSGCGTFALPRTARSLIAGYDRRFLSADLSGVLFVSRSGECLAGQISIFSERLAGGTRDGELLLRMPSVSTVASRRVLRVTGSSHKVTTYPDCGDGTSCSDDITRRVSVTFKKL